MTSITDANGNIHNRDNGQFQTKPQTAAEDVELTPDSRHFAGDSFNPKPDVPIRLEVVIDNQDGQDYPDNPFTLNLLVNGEHLLIGGEGSLIEGDIPTQLREIADLIEKGETGR